VPKIRYAAAALVALTFVLTACGSSQKPEVQNNQQSADDSIPAPIFPVGSSLEKIQQGGKLKIGVPFNQPGFGVKSSTDVEPQGFDIEIAKLIAQGIFGGVANDAAQHIEWVETVSNNRETFLQNHTVDMVVDAYPITDARRKLVDFAGPYYVSHGDVLVQTADRSLQLISDLNGRTVCAKSGSTLIRPLQSKAPQVNIVTAETYQQCMSKLTDGSANGVASDEVVLAGLVASGNATTRVLHSNFSDDPYGIGVPLGDDTMRSFLNDRIEAVERNGDWAQAYAKTLGTLGLAVPPLPSVDRYVSTTVTTR
jgi:glutamate transport system substrate-binding protein